MPSVEVGSRAGRSLGRRLAAGLLLAGATWLGVLAAERTAARAFLNLGPNDPEYVAGFRDDWERDGRTIFHWTTLSSRITLPLGIRGEGFRLRLRARRHFPEPAQVVVAVQGLVAGSFELSADSPSDARRPYSIRELRLPRLDGSAPLRIDLLAVSSHPRPLGIALDWVEIERPAGSAWVTSPATLMRALALVLGGWALLLAAGSRPWPALVTGFVLAGAATLGLASDPLAAERILRLGFGPVLLVGVIPVVLGRTRKATEALGLGPGGTLAALTAVVMTAMAVRATLLFHPEYFYPDVRVHAVFARELGKLGLAEFLRTYTANQFRYSLGLQYESGHWYAFPYPPAFYVLCWPLLKLAGLRPEAAVSTLATVANSLEALVVFALARRFTPSRTAALAAAAAVPLLPIFLVRLSLAYFPALLGHFVDACLLCFLAWRWKRLGEWRQALALAVFVAVALLCYTQSVLNLGLLLPLLLLVQGAADRSPEGRRRQLGLLAAGTAGVLLSMVFYGRYLPIFRDMHRGVPMAGEEIVLARVGLEAGKPSAEEADDPFSGPGFVFDRGLRKAAWRFWIFHDALVPAVLAGLLLAVRGAPDPDLRRLALVWASTYLLLNFASGSLPGPNLVRYNKDLEVIAPLVCVGLGLLWDWLSARFGRGASAALTGLYLWVGTSRAVRALADRIVIERAAS